MKYEQAKQSIDAINDEDYKPNAWEGQFVEDVLNRKQDLSPKQSKVIENIYAKAVGGGVYQQRDRF